MAHDCPRCESMCYCDMEDHFQDAPDDCRHVCAEPGADDDYEELEEALDRVED